MNHRLVTDDETTTTRESRAGTSAGGMGTRMAWNAAHTVAGAGIGKQIKVLALHWQQIIISYLGGGRRKSHYLNINSEFHFKFIG